MSNVIQIKNGATAPTTSNLQPYELGYVRGGALYINNNGAIAQLTNPKVIGLVNSNNYLVLPTITNANQNTKKILVCDGDGQIKFRTDAEVRSDIGALPTSGGTISGNLTVTGNLTTNGNLTGKLIVSSGNWGYSAPTAAGVNGQLYFVLAQG